MGEEPLNIFRREAIEHHRSSAATKSELLRLSPEWMRWTYPLLLAMTIAGLLYLTLGRLNIYASGPAVVRALRRTDVASPTAALVEEVAVLPGQTVRAGDVLVKLESASQSAELERVTRDFEDQLASTLRDPLDEAGRRNLATLRAEKDFAERMLESRRLRSPQAGIVADVRVRAGQSLTAGQIAVTVSSGASELLLVAAIPGQFRPQ